jgi:hypothetical protein
MLQKYETFLSAKAPLPKPTGMDAGEMPAHLYDFQRDVTAFLLKQGCAGLFLDTGLGKTAIQLEWCRQAERETNKPSLLLTPLAVARQIEREAHKFGYEARVIRNQSEASTGLNICNYDRLDKLDTDYYGAVSLDESSLLKSFGGKTSRALIESFAGHRFRLAATATPAPNDHMELGQHSEFLGQMGSMEMLSRWFINDTSTASQSWRLKRSAVEHFWDWVSGWARAAQSPADLGYDASRFVLEPLKIIRHQAFGDIRPAAGSLFIEDLSATNIHDVKRQTAQARAEAVGAMVMSEPDEPWLIWADSDYESDALMLVIPDAVEVRGSHSPERKEANLMGFVDGGVKRLVTKPGIAGQGLNFQHCARMAYVGRSFSYEQFYQTVRRCWRFGQTRQVHVHIMVAEGEDQIGRVIDRKAADHDTMKRAMAAAMQRTRSVESQVKVSYNPTYKGEFPTWLRSAA